MFKEDEKNACLLMGSLFLVHSDQGGRSGEEVIMILFTLADGSLFCVVSIESCLDVWLQHPL